MNFCNIFAYFKPDAQSSSAKFNNNYYSVVPVLVLSSFETLLIVLCCLVSTELKTRVVVANLLDMAYSVGWTG